jgi:hypothetical protein
MNILRTTTIVIAMLFSSIAFLRSQSSISLPEPLLPRAEAGVFKHRLEKLRTMLLKGDLNDFPRSAWEIMYDIEQRIEKEKEVSKQIRTKEELVAQEWMYFYICMLPLPSLKTMWEEGHKKEEFFGVIASVRIRITIIPEPEIEKYGLNKKDFLRVRAAYTVWLLRKFQKKEKEIREEKAGIIARRIDEEIKYRRENFDRLAKGKEETQEEAQKRSIIEGYRRNSTTFIGDSHLLCRTEVQWGEEALLRFLFDYFYEDFPRINEYLTMAGYGDLSKRADLLVRMRTEFRDSTDTDFLFERYIKRAGLKNEQLDRLAVDFQTKEKAEQKRMKEKWARIAATRKTELEALRKEIAKVFIEHRKKTIQDKEKK